MYIDDHGPCIVKAKTGIKVSFFSHCSMFSVNVKEEAV